METMIPSDDPVRLLSAFVEGMDLSELYHTYDRVRKTSCSIDCWPVNASSCKHEMCLAAYRTKNRGRTDRCGP